MTEPASPEPALSAPSPWVSRFLPAAPADRGHALDLAAGKGRHTKLARSRGWRVTAVDLETGALAALAAEDDGIAALEMNLETSDTAATVRALGAAGPFDIVIVCNYLHRPLLPHLPALLKPGGRLIYETFMIGNEAHGRPRNPDFLLRPGRVAQGLRWPACGAGVRAGLRSGPVAPRRPALRRDRRPRFGDAAAARCRRKRTVMLLPAGLSFSRSLAHDRRAAGSAATTRPPADPVTAC